MSCAMLMLTSLASCSKDDDDNKSGLSEQEKSQIFQAAQGTHTGDLFALYSSTYGMYKVMEDSLPDFKTTIQPDTTITVADVPDSLFAMCLDKAYTEQNNLAQALHASNATHTHRAKIYTLGYYDDSKSTYSYTSNYVTTNLTLNINGKDEPVSIITFMKVFYTPGTKVFSTLIIPQCFIYKDSQIYPSGTYFGILTRK